MAKNQHIGLLTALLRATQAGALTDLRRLDSVSLLSKLKRFFKDRPTRRQLSQTLWYIKRKGFWSSQERDGKLTLSLTYKGQERMLSLERQNLTIKRPKRWNGKWHLVTFDIPEKRRFARDNFRLALKKMGLVKIAGSLWIHPYDCRRELDFLTDALLIKPYVHYFVVQSFDGEEELVKTFGITEATET